MRIAIGQVAHETNTFSNVKTTIDSFKLWEWEHGESIWDKHVLVKDYIGGMIDRSKELGVEIVPTFSTFANPSGRITKETFSVIKEELLSSITDSDPVDGICLHLHGAGAIEELDDLEGDLLKSIRNLVGKDIPIVVVLDLHANITNAMIEYADVLLGNIEYPHTDSYERGIEAIDLTVRLIKEEVKIEMVYTKLPLLIPTTTSYDSPIKEINNWCQEWEKHPEVIDCTLFHGFPYADIPEAGLSIITITNQNRDLAIKLCVEMAEKIWDIKKDFFKPLYLPKEAMSYARMKRDYPLVINEASDNPGAGTPGDGTYLLEEMIKENIPNSCFGFIYDPEVAEIAHQVGVGSFVQVELGGKTDKLHGKPLKIGAYVKCLTDGQFIQTSPMWEGKKIDLGKSARLQVGNVDIIVCSVCSQTFDEQIFLLHGIDVSKAKVIGLKSSHHFRAAFMPIANEIISVDSPGLSTSDLTSFRFEKVARPVFPLDQDVDLVGKNIGRDVAKS